MQASPRSHFWRGLRNSLPFMVVVAPFGMLFGVVATEAGLRLPEVMGFSVLVIAGAAQFAALPLMKVDAPTLIVLVTALAVNLRMAMYSASITPYLGEAPMWQRAVMAYFLVDQSYAASIAEFERRPDMSLAERTAYFFGVMTPVCLPWYFATWAGATLGAAIPSAFALDFAVPITFLAIAAPMLRSPAHLAAAAVSVTVALGLAFLPYNLGLLIAAASAMMVGARIEIWQDRRRIAQ